MILDKAKMAHDCAIEMLKRGDPERSIAFDAWTLADTTQAEADKRVVKLPDVFFDTKPITTKATGKTHYGSARNETQ